MPRSAGRKEKLEKPEGWRSPREQFIYSTEYVTVEELARLWKGHPGCSASNLKRICAADRWRHFRFEHLRKTRAQVEAKLREEDAERRADAIRRANDRHIQAGQHLQSIGVLVWKRIQNIIDQEGAGGMKPEAALRELRSLMKEGVTIERKGLGLEDRIVFVHQIEQLVQNVLVVVQRYVKDPTIYENITRDLENISSDARQDVDEVLGDLEEG